VTTNHETESVELPHIRQSFHCYYLGLLGLIPFIGVAPAWQALTRFKKIRHATGETERSLFPKALFFIALLSFPYIWLGAGFPTVTILFLLLSVVYALWMRKEFTRTRPARWNPARHFAWAGATCARVSLAASALLLELLYAFTYANTLLVVK
jgi:hypothetical protein